MRDAVCGLKLRWGAALAGAVLIFLAVKLPAADIDPVIVLGESASLCDLVSAELAADGSLAVVERRHMRGLLQEKALAGAVATPENRSRLGRILGARAVVYFRPAGSGRWQIQVTDAASGRLLAGRTVSVPEEQLAESIRNLLNAPVAMVPRQAVRVAVPDFSSASEETAPDLLLLAEAIRLLLKSSGCDVLDRAAAAQVANEQELGARGWVDHETSPAELLGADLLVTGRWNAATSQVELCLVSPASGRLVQRESFPVAFPAPASASRDMLAWIRSHLPAGTVPPGEAVLLPRQMEALEPFYRGIRLFQAGKVLEAAAEFQKAYTLNDKFEEAYFWEARCYDRAGLPALAHALRRFVELDIAGRGVSSMSAAVPSEGMTFLGIAGPSAPPALRHRLDVLVTEAAAAERRRVLLPENLAFLRDEYDLLLGVENSRGHSWRQSPGFLLEETLAGTLARTETGWRLTLEVRDTVGGDLLARGQVVLGADPATWSREVNAGMKELLRTWRHERTRAEPDIVLAEEEDRTPWSVAAGNATILRTLLENPDALARDWRPLEKPSFRLPIALNLALREELLARMSPDHPDRPWFELERIAGFLPFTPRATQYAREVPDPIAALEAFVGRHPDDLPGLVAEYMLIWETLSRRPPAEIERRTARLEERLRAVTAPPELKGWETFRPMAGQLNRIAAAAQGKDVDLPHMPSFYAACHRMIPAVGEGSAVSLVRKSEWATNEWSDLAPDAPRSRQTEARAALAILGRGHNRYVVEPEWMDDFPDSVILASYIIRSLQSASGEDSLPVRFPFDAGRETAHFRRMVDYAYGQLRRMTRVATDGRQLEWLEQTLLPKFFTALALPGFRLTVPDDELETMRTTLSDDLESAFAALGTHRKTRIVSSLLPWKNIDRKNNSLADPLWRFDQEKAHDRDFLARQASTWLSEAGDKPLLASDWFRRLRGKAYRTLPPGTLARLYRDALPRLLAEYQGRTPGRTDSENLLHVGATLLAGGAYAEAEDVFLIVAGSEDQETFSDSVSAGLRANALLNLGALALHAGRDTEAAALLRRAVVLSGDGTVPVTGVANWRSGHSHSVQALAVRLLTDMREQIPENQIVHAVGQVRVPADGYFPGPVSYFYRVPAGYTSDGNHPSRVLLIVPSINQDAAEYCRTDHAWARFADENQLFLVVPRFMPFWTNCTMPQEWSGEATLAALREIGRRHGFEPGKLWVHGYGRGAAFLQRFVMWRPDLCSAASLHSTFDWAWEDSQPAGLRALKDLKAIPFFITCGELDGEVDSSHAATVRFVTHARPAGLSIRWKSLPGVVHRPPPEMEQMARDFFKETLHAPGADPVAP